MPKKGHKKVSDLLELQLQVAVSHPTLVLVAKLWSSKRMLNSRKHQDIFLAPQAMLLSTQVKAGIKVRREERHLTHLKCKGPRVERAFLENQRARSCSVRVRSVAMELPH